MKQIGTMEGKKNEAWADNKRIDWKKDQVHRGRKGRDGHGGREGKMRNATQTWSCRMEEGEIMSLSPPTKPAMSRPKLPQTPTHPSTPPSLPSPKPSASPSPVSVLLLSCCHHVSIWIAFYYSAVWAGHGVISWPTTLPPANIQTNKTHTQTHT